MHTTARKEIKVIIGLGNPGARFEYTRHNIGFRVLDALAVAHNGVAWQEKKDALYSKIQIHGHELLLIKPQTFMNDSGKVFPALAKQGITAQNMLVIHDELEKPFGSVSFKVGGSHRGHNGLRSLIAAAGDGFLRLRCGIGRPENKDEVPDYVLARFQQSVQEVDAMIEKAVSLVETLFEE